MNQQITITLDKHYNIAFNGRTSTRVRSFQSMVNMLAGVNFAMVRFQFDSFCFSSATDAQRQREYNTFMRRVEKFAEVAGREVATVENVVIRDHVMPYQWTAVVI